MKKHVTEIGVVPGGYSWACSCGIASFVTFFQRPRAIADASQHRAKRRRALLARARKRAKR